MLKRFKIVNIVKMIKTIKKNSNIKMTIFIEIVKIGKIVMRIEKKNVSRNVKWQEN